MSKLKKICVKTKEQTEEITKPQTISQYALFKVPPIAAEPTEEITTDDEIKQINNPAASNGVLHLTLFVRINPMLNAYYHALCQLQHVA